MTATTETARPNGSEGGPSATRIPPARLIGAVAVFALTLVAMAVVTIFRYGAPWLQADGVQQSIMSVQNVDLFFWGQNRFAAVVSFLASPFADPGVNLFVCLLINALCFYGLLLVVARMGVEVLTGDRSWTATWVLWLALAATANIVIAPQVMHVISLESQPYSMSWLLTLGAFLSWKRSSWWNYALAAAMVGVAMGLNPSVITVAAFLALLEMFRRRQWFRWPLFGAVWVAWFGVWQFLSARFGGNAGPIPDANQEYFAWSHTQFVSLSPWAMNSISFAFGPTRLMAMAALACVAAALLAPHRRAALLPRFALTMLFSVLYFVLFAGNPWVAANQFPVRYFFPVLLAIVVFVAAPIVGALLALRRPFPVTVLRPVLAVAAAAAAAASLVGPLTPPSDAPVLEGVRKTADFAEANGVSFLSGYYWDMWPLLYETLDQGRDSHFVTAFKSGGDPSAYRERFEADLASGTPKALCVNEPESFCQTYLDYWTAPGWHWTGEICPEPEQVRQLGTPPERSCRVMAYTGQP